MKSIKRMAVCLLAVVLMLSLAACGGGGLFGGKNRKNVFRVGIDENTEENAMMQSLIAGFKKANPDVTIEFSVESYSGNYSDKLVSQASSGELPDLFFTLDSLVGYFASTKITVDLSEYFEQYNFSTDLIYEDVAKVGMVGNEVHMLGREYSQVVMYYNKAIFDDAGQSYPTDDWTWDDAVAAARNITLTDNDGTVLRAGIDMRLNWPVTMLQYFEGNGGKLFNAEGTAGAINENARQAYVELRDLTREGVILDTFGNTGLSFTGGNVGMYFGVRSDAATVNKSLSSWDVVHVPAFENNVVALGASGYSVSALGQHKDVAVRFLFYIMSEEGQTILAKSGNVVPALKSLADSSDWINYPKTGINYSAFLQEESVQKVYPISSYMNKPQNATMLTDALNKQVTSMILSSKGSISAATWSAYEQALTTAMK